MNNYSNTDPKTSPLGDEQLTEEDLERTITLSKSSEKDKLLPQDQIATFASETNVSENNSEPSWLLNVFTQELSNNTRSQSFQNYHSPLTIADELGIWTDNVSTNSPSSNLTPLLKSSSDGHNSVNNTVSPSPITFPPNRMNRASSLPMYLETQDELSELKYFFQVLQEDVKNGNLENIGTFSTQESTDPSETNLATLDEFLEFNPDDEAFLSRTTSIDSANFGTDQFPQLDELLEINSAPVSRSETQFEQSHFEQSHFNKTVPINQMDDPILKSPIVRGSRRVSCPPGFHPTRILNSGPTSPVFLSNDRILEMTVTKKSTSPRSSNHNQDSYVCVLCGNILSRAANLKQHYLSVHGEERPYPCRYPDCHWSFSRTNDRTRHENQHNEVRKYVCFGILPTGKTFGCGKRFKRSDGLGRHFRTENGKKCISPLTEYQKEVRRDDFDREDNV
ncbi:Transcriptional regulator CRZ1 [Spathaspora sp. JA1]|nr:Transcriptional regulator CRZ1 [Spathaspora sp. JA1]